MSESTDPWVVHARGDLFLARRALRGASKTARPLSVRLRSLADAMCGLFAAKAHLDEYDEYDARAKR